MKLYALNKIPYSGMVNYVVKRNVNNNSMLISVWKPDMNVTRGIIIISSVCHRPS